MATVNGGSRIHSHNAIIIILASLVSGLLIGLSGWTLHEVNWLEAKSAKLDADNEFIKLVLTKMADRMNQGK